MTRDLALQLQRANELLALGRNSQAIELLLQLLRAHPDQAGPIEICLSRAHLVAGRAKEGREHALRGVALEPQNYAGHLLLGLALHMLRRPNEALEPLRTATRLELNDADPPQRLAQVLADMGRLDEAYAAAGEALRRDPHSAKNHFAMGYVLHESNPAEATRAYRKALELDPEHHGAKHNLAGVAVQRGDWAAGSRGMAEVLASSPQAKTPVFVMDQRIVGTIRWLHWLLFGGWLLYAPWTELGPIGPSILVVVLLVGAVLLVRQGIKPIRAALPHGGGQFFAGFPRRERIATIWAAVLGLGWLWLVGATVAGWLTEDGQWAGMGVIGFLLVGLVLSWVRVPIASAKAQRLRHTL